MNFNPSTLITIAIVITFVGVVVGAYALIAEFHEQRAATIASDRLREKLVRAVLAKQPTSSKPTTLSSSSVQMDEFDASRIQRVS